jgi:pilus assembly protein CpaF
VDAIDVVEDEVRELVRRRGLDPSQDVAAIRRLVDDVIADYDERTLTGALPALANRGVAARSVYDAVAGFGPLQPYLDDPQVEEIWVNDPGRVFIARRGRSELTTTILRPDEVRDLVERMLKSSGRRATHRYAESPSQRDLGRHARKRCQNCPDGWIREQRSLTGPPRTRHST